MKSTRFTTIAFLSLFLTVSASAEPSPKLDGKTIETGRHRITLAESGLPEQIEIVATQSELPLELRGAKKEVSDQVLREIGRGKQLRAPIRIEVAAAGKTIAAEPEAPAQPALKGGAVVCRSKLKAGKAALELDLTYGSDGALTGSVQYGGKGSVEAIGLAIDLAGTVDLAFAGSPVAENLQVHRAADFAVSEDEGLVWGNSERDARAEGRRPAPGPVTRMFVGSGDRGFTWLSEAGKGWNLDAKASTATLTRDKDGAVTWRILFVNHKTRLKRSQSIKFAFRVHPARARDAKHRSLAWLEWPHGAKAGEALPATLSERKEVDLIRAGTATVHEAHARYAVLEGAAGGDALASAGTHAETWPIGLFRYLAGAHTSLVTRLRSNARTLTRPGADPAADRVLLGRALLCDIGLDAESLADLAGAARVLSALDKFGTFEPDGQTELIPFWRSRSIIRFGETFSEDDAFSLSTENPVAQVYVSVYRRPKPRRGVKALIVVANESAKPVRDQLYILNPKRIFGGANTLEMRTIKDTLDFTRFHERSDWMRLGVIGRGSNRRGTKGLQDLEDQGAVRQNAAKDGIEAYGPHVFIPAHDFRILYGVGK